VVRSRASLPDALLNHENLSVTEASLLDLSDADLAHQVQGCSAVASCLGHNISLKGLYGHPHRLVTDASRRICEAIPHATPSAPWPKSRRSLDCLVSGYCSKRYRHDLIFAMSLQST
jgi:hypothetical protein